MFSVREILLKMPVSRCCGRFLGIRIPQSKERQALLPHTLPFSTVPFNWCLTSKHPDKPLKQYWTNMCIPVPQVAKLSLIPNFKGDFLRIVSVFFFYNTSHSHIGKKKKITVLIKFNHPERTTVMCIWTSRLSSSFLDFFKWDQIVLAIL